MTTAGIDIFIGNRKTPYAWISISHDGYNGKGGIEEWLTDNLVKSKNPPKTVQDLVDLMKNTKGLGMDLDPRNVASDPTWHNMEEGPYTLHKDYAIGESRHFDYNYRVRCFDGKWTVDCNMNHSAKNPATDAVSIGWQDAETKKLHRYYRDTHKKYLAVQKAFNKDFLAAIQPVFAKYAANLYSDVLDRPYKDPAGWFPKLDMKIFTGRNKRAKNWLERICETARRNVRNAYCDKMNGWK